MKIETKNAPVIPVDELGNPPVPYMINNKPHVVMARRIVKCSATLCSEYKTILIITKEPFYGMKEIKHSITNSGDLMEYFADLVKTFNLKPSVPATVYFSVDGYYRGTSKDDKRVIGFQAVSGYTNE